MFRSETDEFRPRNRNTLLLRSEYAHESFDNPPSRRGRPPSRCLLFSSRALAANTQDNVVNGQSDLTQSATYSGGTPTTTSDVTFLGATTDSPLAFTLNTATTFNLNICTLDDLDATQALTIQNNGTGTSTITLNGGTNVVAPANGGAAGDLLFVASGGTLTIGGGTGAHQSRFGHQRQFRYCRHGHDQCGHHWHRRFQNNRAGTLTLSGTNTYSGTTTANGGTLLLNFRPQARRATASSTTRRHYVDNLDGVCARAGGRHAQHHRRTTASATNSQAFNGTTVNTGYSVAAFTATAGNTINLDLGAITRTVAGGTVDFTQSSVGTTNIYTNTPNPTFTNGTNTILGGWALFTPSGSTSPTTWATTPARPEPPG